MKIKNFTHKYIPAKKLPANPSGIQMESRCLEPQEIFTQDIDIELFIWIDFFLFYIIEMEYISHFIVTVSLILDLVLYLASLTLVFW